METKEINEIQKTIIEQFRYAVTSPEVLNQLGLKVCLYEADHKVRFHFRKSGRVINIDVEYIFGRDTYTVKAYKIKGIDCEEIYSEEDIYCDQFADVIGSVFNIPYQKGGNA